MQALTLNTPAHTALLSTIPIPTPKPTELLIKIHTISLNPIDPLYVAHPLAPTGRTIGSDFAGTITSLGSSVPASSPTDLKPGDRVAGFLQGACSVNERPGAFAEYAVAEWDLVWKIPDTVSFEQAAGVSLVALTAAQGLWFRLGLPAPFDWDEGRKLRDGEHGEWSGNSELWDKKETVTFFVYGASTSVGLYAAKMARKSAQRSGKTVRLFGAASRARWEMLRAAPYFYDHLVDYRDGEWPEQIRSLTDGEGIHYGYDGISEGESVANVSSTLALGGRMVIVRSKPAGAWNPANVVGDPIYGAVWEGLGAEVQYQGFTVKKSLAARAFAVEFYRWLSESAGAGMELNAIRVMPGGLQRVVQDGFELLGAGKVDDRAKKERKEEEWMRPVSAEKLVYRIAE